MAFCMLGLRLNSRIHMKYSGVVMPHCNSSAERVGQVHSYSALARPTSLLDEFQTSERAPGVNFHAPNQGKLMV